MAASHASEGAGPLKTPEFCTVWRMPCCLTTTPQQSVTGRVLKTWQVPANSDTWLGAQCALTNSHIKHVSVFCFAAQPPSRPKHRHPTTKLHTAYVASRIQGESITRHVYKAVTIFCVGNATFDKVGSQKGCAEGANTDIKVHMRRDTELEVQEVTCTKAEALAATYR